jgi:hypothetical protein
MVTMADGKTGIAQFDKPSTVFSYEQVYETGALMASRVAATANGNELYKGEVAQAFAHVRGPYAETASDAVASARALRAKPKAPPKPKPGAVVDTRMLPPPPPVVAPELLNVDLDNRLQGRLLINGFKRLLAMYGTPNHPTAPKPGSDPAAGVEKGTAKGSGGAEAPTAAGFDDTASAILGFKQATPKVTAVTAAVPPAKTGDVSLDLDEIAPGDAGQPPEDANVLCQRGAPSGIGFQALLGPGQLALIKHAPKIVTKAPTGKPACPSDVVEPDISKDHQLATSVTFLRDTHRTPPAVYMRHFNTIHSVAPKQVMREWIFWYGYNALKCRIGWAKSPMVNTADNSGQCLQDPAEWESILEAVDATSSGLLYKVVVRTFTTAGVDCHSVTEQLLEEIIVRYFISAFGSLSVSDGSHVLDDLPDPVAALIAYLTRGDLDACSIGVMDTVKTALLHLNGILSHKASPPQLPMTDSRLRTDVQYVITPPLNEKDPSFLRADRIRSWVHKILCHESSLGKPFTHLIMSFKPYVIQHAANEEVLSKLSSQIAARDYGTLRFNI